MDSSASIAHCIGMIDLNGLNAVVFVSPSGEFEGILTDGDVRRALLSGAQLEDPARPYVQTDAVVSHEGESRTSVLEIMQVHGLSVVPVLGPDSRLIGLHVLREFLQKDTRDNVAVLMAGGRGERLGALTAVTPKPMVRVAGRPILERLVSHLVGFGFRRIVLSIGYLGDQIEQYFQDGSGLGCEIQYLREDVNAPLGTAGALALLPELEALGEDPVLCMNGDIVTQANIGAMLDFHSSSDADMCIGSVAHGYQVPYGVLTARDDGRVLDLAEKPTRYEVVSAGIYTLSPALIDIIPKGKAVNMTEVVSSALEANLCVCHWDCGSDWIDVGQPHDLARARGI